MRLRSPHIALGPMLAVALLTATSSAAAPCPALRLDAVTPGQGSVGDTVQLKGEGFCGGENNYFAWGWDGAQGFPIKIDGAKAGELSGTVGPVAAKVSGPIRLWSGDVQKVKRQSITAEGGRYGLSGSIFRVTEATAGGHFIAKKSARAVTSSLDSGALRMPLPPPPPKRSGLQQDKRPKGEISIIIIVETCGPPDDDDQEPEGEDSAVTKRFLGRLNLKCLEDARACGRLLPSTVATTIDQGLGHTGLRARVDGPDIVISHGACPITAGFATISQ